MRKSLPRVLGIVGLALGFAFTAMWWYIDTYDPFHLPTTEQVQAMPDSYPTPHLYTLLRELTFVFLPGIWLQVFTIHLGRLINYPIWLFAALLDGAIFYCIGVLIRAIWRRMPRRE